MLEDIKIFLWSFPCALFVIITGSIILIKTKFYFIKKIGYIVSSVFKSSKKDKNSFGLMCTSLGGAIGVGNAVGVAGAIYEGGAGAVFWMGIATFFSIGIKYSEIYLSLLYKTKDCKGPFAYIKEGINSSFLAYCYAFLSILVSLGMGNISQIKAGINAVSETFHFPSLFFAIVITILFFFTAVGGIKKIAGFSEIAVPFLTIAYTGVLIIIIIKQRENIPEALKNVINGSGVFYGIKWSLIKVGISGGFSKSFFSTEAGLGSAGFTHGESNCSPESQAKWGVIEVLIDSIICIMTAIAILTAGDLPSFKDASFVTKGIFEKILGKPGEYFYSVSMLLFAFTSTLCWYYNGLCSVKFIKNNNLLKSIYIFTFSIIMLLSPVISDNLIVNLSDIANSILMLLNLPILLLLTKKIKTD